MNPARQTFDAAQLAASYMDWLALAGLDCAVTNSPRSWFRQAAAPAPVDVAPAQKITPAKAPSATTMPAALAPFLEWLATDPDQPEAVFANHRLLPEGPSGAPVMLVLDMPGPSDHAAGRWLAGDEGLIADAMLRAMGLQRAEIAVGGLLLARPPGGIADAGLLDKAAARFRHLVGLMAPRQLIIMGDRTSRALGGTGDETSSLSLPGVDHEKGTVPAMHMPAPLVLMQHPARKSAVWKSLRHLAYRP